MKYPQYVIDYAIDNKISLEEANKHFTLNGNNKDSEKPLDNSIITKEEYDWVDQELKEVDKLYNKMYGKDV